jgi:EAL domain-containing protein (putative c-di-GMP-specific phosphodiesterase class I)
MQEQVHDYIQYYHPDMSDKVMQEQNIVNDMQPRWTNGSLWSISSLNTILKTERPYGAEALIRWKHPEKGFPPGEFIPVFERNGFIGKVDYYVWESVCAFCANGWTRGLTLRPYPSTCPG